MQGFIYNVHILPKESHQEAFDLGCQIKRWLEQKQVRSSIYSNEDWSNCLLGKDQFGPDLLLVLGGDGTILSVVGKLHNPEVPVLGFNFGHVGFLTELDPDHWEQDMQQVLQNKFSISERLLLNYQLIRQERIIRQGSFINDLVVGRGSLARLIDLTLWSGEDKITDLRADGLIASTPLGSTAYSLAAGGPLISPELDVMEICPVCPFLNDIRPIVLPASAEITIRVESSLQGEFLTLDGQTGIDLISGDKIKIEKSSKKLQLVQLGKSSYIQKLRSKGYITPRKCK